MTNVLVAQVIGVVRLTIPLFLLYKYAPSFIPMPAWLVLSAILIGAYAGFLQYDSSSKQVKTFVYIPTNECKQMFDNEIKKCGLEPKKVNVRYAYADDAVAITMLNTVLVDPFVWQGVENDEQAQKVKDIVKTHVVPNVPEEKKQLYAKMKQHVSQDAQRFIFRHELGHVFYNYSNKRIVLTGLQGTTAASIGLFSAHAAITLLGGPAALLFGMVAGGMSDIMLTYVVNFFFKANEEKKADLFAAQHSSKEEILAAADFFEQYEKDGEEYKKAIGASTILPSVLLTGHPAGSTRAAYLRKLV